MARGKQEGSFSFPLSFLRGCKMKIDEEEKFFLFFKKTS